MTHSSLGNICSQSWAWWRCLRNAFQTPGKTIYSFIDSVNGFNALSDCEEPVVGQVNIRLYDPIHGFLTCDIKQFPHS